jgi:hypothetical protein
MTARKQKAPRALCVVLVAASGCAPRLAPLPAGIGTPVSDHTSAYAQATDQCRAVRTLVGVMTLSGRAGRSRMRGNVEVGLAAPGSARLEAPGPFGSRPIFVFTARDDSATLVLPRDRRVLRDARPEAVVEALAGVPLGPDDLRAALAGCGLGSGAATNGRAFDSNWIAVDAGSATQWLRQIGGSWRVVASVRGPLDIRYSEFASGRPSVVRIRRTRDGAGTDADLAIRLSQVDINVPLEPAVFDLDVPPDATPMTLEELRQAGPLGARQGSNQ